MISQPHASGTSQGIRSQKSTSQSPCSSTCQLPPAVGNILSVCPDSGSLQVVVRLVAHEEVKCGVEASAGKKRSRGGTQHEDVQRGDGEGKCEPVHARGASVCSSGPHVAVACSGGGTFVWEVETGRQAASLHAKSHIARPAGRNSPLCSAKPDNQAQSAGHSETRLSDSNAPPSQKQLCSA
jgi:hypothetical protein